MPGNIFARLGSSIGQGLGQGANSGVDALLQHKMQQMHAQRGIKGLEAAGFSPEQAQGLNGLDPQILKEIVKEKIKPKTVENALSPQGYINLGFSPQEANVLISMDPKERIEIVKARLKELTAPQGIFGNLFGHRQSKLASGNAGSFGGQQDQGQQFSGTSGNFAGDLAKLAAQSGAGLAAGAGGQLGNIQQLGQAISKPVNESYLKLLGQLSGQDFNNIEQKPTFPLPTTESIKETVGQYLPEGTLIPQNRFTQGIGDFFQDLGSLLSPIPGLGAVPVAKAARIAGLGSAASTLAAGLGLNKDQQDTAKLVTLLTVPTIVNSTQLGAQADKLIDKAKSSIKPNVTVPVSKTYSQNLNDLSTIINKAKDSPAKDSVIEALSNTRNVGHKVPVEDLVNLSQALETAKQSADFLPNSRNTLDKALKEIYLNVSQYKDPKFKQLFDRANAIKAGIGQKSTIQETLKKNLPYNLQRYINPTTATLLGLPSAALGGGVGKIGKTVIAATAAGEAEKAIKALSHPAIRKEVLNIFAAATKNQAKLLPSLVKKLDKAIKNEE